MTELDDLTPTQAYLKGLDDARAQAAAQPEKPRQISNNVEEIKYLKLLRWFKFFYKFFQDDVKGKPSACASALAEDGELQEFIREANRIG